MKQIRTLARCEDGVTLVEYGIALLLAITLGTAALVALGNDINAQLTETSDAF